MTRSRRLHDVQPHQTLYVPQPDRVTRPTVREFGAEALRLIEAHAPTRTSFVDAFGVPAEVAERTRERTRAKLERRPVEDLRVDFEDGYGVRSDDEEDRHAEAAAARPRGPARGRDRPRRRSACG